MASREHLVRAMWTLFEPIHAVSYFSPQSRDAFAAVGLTRYWDGYFGGRAAPLGPVGGAPVAAVFSGFSEPFVARALPALWSRVTPEQALTARTDGAVATLRELVPDAAAVALAGEALTRAADRVDVIGRPLTAANRALAPATEPYSRLWQASATLREHRGEGHVIALVTEEIAGLTTLVLRSAVDLDAATMRRLRGWTEPEWAAEVDRLVGRGLLDSATSITSSGADALNAAEDQTNRLALAPWSELSDDDLREAARAVAPVARACGVLYPYPNPIGMSQPWDPDGDPDAASVPAEPVTA